MEVLILGVYLEISIFRIKWSKIRVRIVHRRALYTGKYGITKLTPSLQAINWGAQCAYHMKHFYVQP